MSGLRWKRALPEDLGAMEAFLRSREAEAAGCIGRLLRDDGEGRRLKLPNPLRGLCHVAVEGRGEGSPAGASGVRPIHGLVYQTSTGIAFPLLPPSSESASDRGIPRVYGDSLASAVGAAADVERFERALGLKPVVAVAYELMARPAAAGPLPSPHAVPGFVALRATEADLEELFPLQEAYENEEVITAIHRFDAAGCRAALKKALREQVVHVGRLGGAAVAKAATNARAFSLDQIGGVFVAPPFRRRGLGRIVVSGLVSELGGQGRGVALFVKSGNEAARGLYDCLGFAALGPFRADYFLG